MQPLRNSSFGLRQLSSIPESGSPTGQEQDAAASFNGAYASSASLPRLRLDRLRPAGRAAARVFGSESVLGSFLREQPAASHADLDAANRAGALFEQVKAMIAVPDGSSTADLAAAGAFAHGPPFRFTMAQDDGTQSAVTIPADAGHQPLVFATTLLAQNLQGLGPGARRSLVKLAAGLPNPWARAQAIAALAPHLAQLEPVSIERVWMALSPPPTAETPDAGWARAYALAALCRLLPGYGPDGQNRLLDLAQTLPGECQRAHVFRAAAATLGRVPAALADRMADMFANGAGLHSESARADLLAGLGESGIVLRQGDAPGLLRAILELHGELPRGRALAGLGRHFDRFSPGLRAQWLDAVFDLQDPAARAAALRGIGGVLPRLEADDRATLLGLMTDLPDPVLRGATLEAIGPALSGLTPGQLALCYGHIMTGRGLDRVQIGADLRIPDLLPPPQAGLRVAQLQAVIETILPLPEAGRAVAIVSLLAWPQRWSPEQRIGLVHMACNLREPRARAAAMAALLALPAFLSRTDRQDVVQSMLLTRDDAAYLDRECRDSLVESLLSVPPGAAAAAERAMLHVLTGQQRAAPCNPVLDGQLTKLAQEAANPDLWRAAVLRLLSAPAELTPPQRAQLFQHGLALKDPALLRRFLLLRLQETTDDSWKYPTAALCAALKRLNDDTLILPALQAMRPVLPKLAPGALHAVLELCGARAGPNDPESTNDPELASAAAAELREVAPRIKTKYVRENFEHNLRRFEQETEARLARHRAASGYQDSPFLDEAALN